MTRYWTGNDPESLAASENVADATLQARLPNADANVFHFIRGRDGFAFTAPVGAFCKPNPLGIHDMHGNVEEWCNDRFSNSYYEKFPAVDPSGPPDPDELNRVVRGGSWLIAAGLCRSACRSAGAQSSQSGHGGFRLALSLSGDQAERYQGENPTQQRKPDGSGGGTCHRRCRTSRCIKKSFRVMAP